MRIFKDANNAEGTPIPLPDVKRLWVVCFVSGAVFWIIALVLWGQQGIDKAVLFYFNAQRIVAEPIVIVSKWFSSYGMATITVIFIVYLLVSKKIRSLDAPVTTFFYTICSYGLGGIAGDLLKLVLARPRPLTTFGSEIMVWSTSATPAIPSGHATKSIALVLPFLLLVSGEKNIHKAVKVVIALIASGVCFSRIVLGAHYVSDVVAGIGMALIGLPFTMMFANMVLRKAKQEQLPVLSMVWGSLLIFLTLLFLAL
jgi:membrane-associated phospholipid phosphatase